MGRRLDVTGQRFGRWVALERVGVVSKGHSLWRCQCDCGETRAVTLCSLRTGASRSCGCLRGEVCAAIIGPRSITHGESSRPEHGVWNTMIQRCTNPNAVGWERYGGRGITVCERWASSYEAFIADMGHRPSPDMTLERIDNSRGYEVGNVRWATRSEQARNRRSNRHITHEGRTQLLIEWAEELSVPIRVLHGRLNRLGWSVERALTTPVRKIQRPQRGQKRAA